MVIRYGLWKAIASSLSEVIKALSFKKAGLLPWTWKCVPLACYKDMHRRIAVKKFVENKQDKVA